MLTYPLHRIIIVFIALFLISCDPLYDVTIINESKQDILVEIEFNKDLFSSADLTFFIKNNNYGLTPLLIDTLENLCRYKLPNERTLNLYQEIATPPNFEIFEKLIIITTTDTLEYSTSKQIENAFEHTNKYYWQMTIK